MKLCEIVRLHAAPFGRCQLDGPIEGAQFVLGVAQQVAIRPVEEAKAAVGEAHADRLGAVLDYPGQEFEPYIAGPEIAFTFDEFLGLADEFLGLAGQLLVGGREFLVERLFFGEQLVAVFLGLFPLGHVPREDRQALLDREGRQLAPAPVLVGDQDPGRRTPRDAGLEGMPGGGVVVREYRPDDRAEQVVLLRIRGRQSSRVGVDEAPVMVQEVEAVGQMLEYVVKESVLLGEVGE